VCSAMVRAEQLYCSTLSALVVLTSCRMDKRNLQGSTNMAERAWRVAGAMETVTRDAARCMPPCERRLYMCDM
jgi:hypothetical protein